MAGQILNGILFLLCFQSLCEVLVCGAALSQQTTVKGSAICKVLKRLETKIDLLLGGKANCSAGRRVLTLIFIER